MMKETIKKLFVMQLSYGGIAEEMYHFLPDNEKKLLVERKGYSVRLVGLAGRACSGCGFETRFVV